MYRFLVVMDRILMRRTIMAARLHALNAALKSPWTVAGAAQLASLLVRCVCSHAAIVRLAARKVSRLMHSYTRVLTHMCTLADRPAKLPKSWSEANLNQARPLPIPSMLAVCTALADGVYVLFFTCFVCFVVGW